MWGKVRHGEKIRKFFSVYYFWQSSAVQRQKRQWHIAAPGAWCCWPKAVPAAPGIARRVNLVLHWHLMKPLSFLQKERIKKKKSKLEHCTIFLSRYAGKSADLGHNIGSLLKCIVPVCLKWVSHLLSSSSIKKQTLRMGFLFPNFKCLRLV